MKRIARQQWRARIETSWCTPRPGAARASPASNGGRGLKRDLAGFKHVSEYGIARQQWRARIETMSRVPRQLKAGSIARQQWRARIETPLVLLTFRQGPASPASNGGRGLKPLSRYFVAAAHRIARQQWRARIETFGPRGKRRGTACIARQQWRARIETVAQLGISRVCRGIARQQWRARIETGWRLCLRPQVRASPASNGGRGLKQNGRRCAAGGRGHRPPAMAGAD